jgi:hypothetical protein
MPALLAEPKAREKVPGNPEVVYRFRCAEIPASPPAFTAMKTTRYFEEQVLRKRPYIQRSWCADVLASPIRREVQPDGRVRFWGRVTPPDEPKPRFFRVITLEDGETVHNAFFDRGFREEDSS